MLIERGGKKLARPRVRGPQGQPQKAEEPAPLNPATEPPEEPDSGLLSGDRGKRVAHFVRGMTLESLQHLRYLSVANAFRNVGGTLGSVGLTPLAVHLARDNAALVGGIGIGGTVAAGAIGAALGYAWLWHRDGADEQTKRSASLYSNAQDKAMEVAAGLQVLPKFLYPTSSGATDAQREGIYNTLDRLPLEDVTASATIQVVDGLTDTGISGMSQPGASHTHILLDSGYLNDSRGPGLVFHEQGHAVDYSGGFGLLGSHNWKAGFGSGEHISRYAESNRYEDWAETYEHYHLDRESVAHLHDKADAIERVSRQNALNRAVDQPKIREAGKRVSETIGKVPYLRTGLELAGSLVAPIQTYRGASKLIDGLETDDDYKKLDGKMTLASGMFLSLPGANPLALVSSASGMALKGLAKDGDQAELDWANKWADRVLATSAGPFGMTVAALKNELGASGMKFDDSQGFNINGWSAARPGKSAMFKGTLATVGGAVGGAVVGAGLGLSLAGAGGAAIGSMWGQVAGGMAGLGLYGAFRTMKGDLKDGHPLALTKGDKKFLAGLAGGAIVGGGLGPVGGSMGGKALGELLGGLAFGPTGAATLGTVGGWAGGLAGAYGGARAGAALGSGRLFQRKPPPKGFAEQVKSEKKS